MELKIKRIHYKEWYTIGKFYINGEYFCDTLEDKDRGIELNGEKVYGFTAIPKGRYKVKVSYSPKFKKQMPLIMDVPQFTGIRIHSGSYGDFVKVVKKVKKSNKNVFIDGEIIEGKDYKLEPGKYMIEETETHWLFKKGQGDGLGCPLLGFNTFKGGLTGGLVKSKELTELIIEKQTKEEVWIEIE